MLVRDPIPVAGSLFLVEGEGRYWEEQLLRRHLDELVRDGSVLETERGFRRA